MGFQLGPRVVPEIWEGDFIWAVIFFEKLFMLG